MNSLEHLDFVKRCAGGAKKIFCTLCANTCGAVVQRAIFAVKYCVQLAEYRHSKIFRRAGVWGKSL